MAMICPKCMRDTFVSPLGEHYKCINDPSLAVEDTGCGAQFEFVQDEVVRFPHNVIFNERVKKEFFRKPYLSITPLSDVVEDE